MRAGAHALTLLAVPLNVHVLTALAEEPKALIDLRRAVGSPPQTTMRKHMRELTRLGIVERRRQADFPGTVDFELGSSGQDLLWVVSTLQTWLDQAPEGPLQLGGIAARSAIKALTEGWSSSIIRALAARPLTLTELDRVIVALSYPSLERRLGAMRLAGQIEPSPSMRRGTPYATTTWLQHAMAPLAAAIRWEAAHMRQTAPAIAAQDVEAIFLLAVPLLHLDPDLSGSCRIAVELRGSKGPTLAGVTVEVQEGRISSCLARVQGRSEAWAVGSPGRWLAAVIENDTGGLEIGGEGSLANAVVEGLNQALFAPAAGREKA